MSQPRPNDVRLPEGWSRSGWIDRLRALADACRAYHPEAADEYDRQRRELERGMPDGPVPKNRVNRRSRQ